MLQTTVFRTHASLSRDLNPVFNVVVTYIENSLEIVCIRALDAEFALRRPDATVATYPLFAGMPCSRSISMTWHASNSYSHTMAGFMN